MVNCIEKMMERFNSGELKRIFRNSSRTVLVGLTTSGRRVWLEEEETRRDTSTVLISCISELFKVIQDVILLILLNRATFSSAPIMSDMEKHQNAVYWVDINLALRKGSKFHQPR